MIIRRLGGWPSFEWRSPFEELERMRRQMDVLADSLSKGAFREPQAGVFPLMNVSENRGNYYVRAELPGLKAEDLDIYVTGNSLSIAGERKIPSEDEKATYHRRERESGAFNRMISLPTDVDTAKVEARCVDGVLTVVLPKSESAKPKQISVKAG
jgi:HSP20 family protein